MRSLNHPPRNRLRIASLLAAATVLLAGCAAPGAEPGGDETFTLTYVSYLGENTPIGLASQWWADEVAERSDGRISVEMYFGAALLPPDEVYAALVDGRVDVAVTAPVYYPEASPYTEVGMLPFQTKNAAASSAAMNQLAAESPELDDEWAARGLRTLTYIAPAPHVLGTQIPLESWKDLAGLNIRALGQTAMVLEGAGAQAVAVPIGELYESLQRGIVDGYGHIWFDLAASLRLVEQAQYLTDDGIGVYGMSHLLTSTALWEELPADLQAVVGEVSDEFAVTVSEFNVDTDIQACEVIQEAGTELNIWSDSEVSDYRAEVEESVIEGWRERIGDASAADEFRSRYLDAVETYEAQYSDQVPGIQRCLESLGG